MDQRGRRPLRPRLHGQHGLERREAHRRLRRHHRPRGNPLRRRARGSSVRRIRSAAPPARRAAARLPGSAYRAGAAAGSRSAGYRGRHRHPGQPLVHRHLVRRNRPCRHHAVGVTARRSPGHDSRHFGAQSADAGSVRRASLHRRACGGGTEHIQFASRTMPVSPIDLRHPEADVLLARGDAVRGVVQSAMRRCSAHVRGDISCPAGRLRPRRDHRGGAGGKRVGIAVDPAAVRAHSTMRSSSCRCAPPA